MIGAMEGAPSVRLLGVLAALLCAVALAAPAAAEVLQRPECYGERATVVGTMAADTLMGTQRDDVIAGLAGGDTIQGGGGDDIVCAGDGDDSVSGGAGDDSISGEA